MPAHNTLRFGPDCTPTALVTGGGVAAGQRMVSPANNTIPRSRRAARGLGGPTALLLATAWLPGVAGLEHLCPLAATPVLAQANAPTPTVSRPKNQTAPGSNEVDPATAPLGTVGGGMAVAPSAEHTMAAYRTIRGQIDQWAVIALPADAPRSGVASAATVQLRLDGKIIGRGTVVSMSPGGEAPVVLAHRAAMEAYTEADRRMPLDRDATRAEQAKLLASRVRVSLELAGPMTPIAPTSYEQLERSGMVDAGLDAMVATYATTAAAVLPSTQISSNLSPAEAMRQAVSAATGQPTLALVELGKLSAEQGVRYYKARTTQIAEYLGSEGVEAKVGGAGAGGAGAGANGTFLYRGARLIPRTELGSEPQLMAFAEAMAGNLARRMHPGSEPLGIRGAHLPWLGTDSPEVASVSEQVLAAYALMRFAEVREGKVAGGAGGAGATGSDAAAAAARAAAMRILSDLDQVRPSETAANADVDTAATVLALLPRATGAGTGRGDDDAAMRLRRLTAGPVEQQTEWATRPPAVQALAALAGARFAPDNATLLKLRRDLLANTPAERLPAMMPFAVMAELAAHPTGELPALTKLREARTLLWSNQLSGGGVAADLQGGIAFTSRGAGGMPTWASARALMAAALMLGDGRLTPASDRTSEIVRIIEAIRFSRQLMMDGESSWAAVRPDYAAGAIRSAPFDWSCPPDATSMTLLAVCETVESLRKMK
jgi:hypothetical protein